ncbi:hypothetical protein GCM10018952_31220 [Streptosporangium vulgare]
MDRYENRGSLRTIQDDGTLFDAQMRLSVHQQTFTLTANGKPESLLTHEGGGGPKEMGRSAFLADIS